MALQSLLIPTLVKDSNAATPAPATGLTTADLARLRHSLDSSVSDNTWTMYASAWRSFEAWAQARGNLSLPASPQLVAAYLAYLAENDISRWPPCGSTKPPWPRSTRPTATTIPPIMKPSGRL